MTEHTLPRHAIVVGVDGSPSSDRALDWAIEQAASTHAPLVLVHAIGIADSAASTWLAQGTAGNPATLLDAAKVEGQRILDLAVRRVTARLPTASVSTLIRAQDPREALLELSDAELIVLGSRGRGPIRSLLMGSVSAAVSRHALCPVVVVRPHNRGVVRRGVLVGSDGTSHSLPALEFAFQYASMHHLPLTAMHSEWDLALGAEASRFDPVLQPSLEDARLLLSESLSGLGERYPDVHVSREVTRGLPAPCLVQEAERMNLVVVGKRTDHEWSPGGLADVSINVVEHARCPVVVVPDTWARPLVTIGPHRDDERL